MSELKIVNIGAFGHSSEVITQVGQTKGAKLVALAPAYDQEDCKVHLDHPDCPDDVQIFDNYEQMLDDIRPDVTIVSTRLDLIPEAAIRAARSKSNLILEKPLALDEDTLKNLYEAVKQNNVKLMAMLSMRAMPHYIAAQQVCASGCIGEVVLVNGRKSYKWGTRPQWFGDKNKYGDTIGWVGIHALDFINFVTDLEFKKVAAMEDNFCHPERKDCQDNCVLVLELSNGGHATISIDYCRPGSAPTHGDDWMRVVGTKGVLEVSGVTKTCKVIEDGKDPYEVNLLEPSMIYENFLLSLLGKENCWIKPHIPFMLTDVCLQARNSLRTGTVTNIEQNKWIF